MIKRIFVKSVALDSAKSGEVEAEIFNDKEWKIIVNCGESTNPPSLAGRINKSNATSQITITFFALDYDIDSLVRGYLATFLGLDSCLNFGANLVRENNMIFVDSHLLKDEILTRLAQKDIIQSCEQIELNDKKINRDSIIMPFNGSRAQISREVLEANRGFFLDSSDFPHKVRILYGKSIESHAESFDTNPKNAIYKAIGKALDLSLRDSQGESKQSTLNPSLQGESLAKQSAPHSSLRGESQIHRSNPQSLLDSTIFLNFRLEIECLKIIILQKCTFIVCAEKPAFSTIKFAQKFGITLMAFTKNSVDSHNADLAQSADLGEFLILTHQMRFVK